LREEINSADGWRNFIDADTSGRARHIANNRILSLDGTQLIPLSSPSSSASEKRIKKITFENRLEYCQEAIDYRISEISDQIFAVRKGINHIIPLSIFALYNYDQIQWMVRGPAEINIKLLQKKTDYINCQKEDPHIIMFWKVKFSSFFV
jgi:hypothetical protein